MNLTHTYMYVFYINRFSYLELFIACVSLHQVI